MSAPNEDFRYLNRDGVWLGFAHPGLSVHADGSATLADLPAPGPLHDGSALPSVAAHDPAGIARDAAGNLYYSLPEQHLVLRIETCTNELAPVPGLIGPGSEPGELHTPRGLLALSRRPGLLICDSDNGRIQIVDAQSAQVLEIWNEPFVRPVAAAEDQRGAIYVADVSAGVVKLSPTGQPVPAFARAVHAQGLTQHAIGIGVVEGSSTSGSSTGASSATRVYVLDRARRAVFVFDEDGQALLDAAGRPLAIGAGVLHRPLALAVGERSIYVCDRESSGAARVLRFEGAPGYAFVGALPGAGAAALLLVGERLWLHRGTRDAPLALDEQQAYLEHGSLQSDVIDLGRSVAWTSVHLHGPRLPAGAHVQITFRISDAADGAGSAWQSGPRDARQLFLGGSTGRYLWLRVTLRGDGLVTPRIENVSVRFDQPGYAADLPAIYRSPLSQDDFLRRLLALFESMNLDIEDAIERLPALFDPQAVAAEHLSWLASWLAVELDERWPVEKQRAAIARAYAADGSRGTIAGLRRAIAFETGLDAVLVEPIARASWWALPESAAACGLHLPSDDGSWGSGSLLGFTTMLAAGEPDSAVIGTSTLDRTRILADGELGAPLFDDYAHHFIAHVYRGRADRIETRAALRELIEREKPAHTQYRLLAIEPRFTVGVQASVGFDTVIAGPPEPSALGEQAGALQLAGEPAAQVGAHSQIGREMRL